MRIKITSDSTCDLSEELIRENDIEIIPLTIIKGGADFKDGRDVFPADIFSHVEKGGALCSTTAVNIGEYRAVFERLSGEYDAVIHINIGSAFSACYQNACLAAEDFPRVRVIDSQNLSTGHGHVVMEACKGATDCSDMAAVDALCAALRELTERVEASFLLNRLDYMVKGGRCSSVAALGANLLKLKPCIEVKDGRMQVVKKYRGSFEKCLSDYVKDRLDHRNDIIRDRVFITHTPIPAEGLQAAASAVTQYGGFNRVYQTGAGCTIACHCGPGTLGVLFIRKGK